MPHGCLEACEACCVFLSFAMLCYYPSSSGRIRADMRRQEKSTNGEHAQPLPSVGVRPLTEISMMSDSKLIHFAAGVTPIILFKLTLTAGLGEYEKISNLHQFLNRTTGRSSKCRRTRQSRASLCFHCHARRIASAGYRYAVGMDTITVSDTPPTSTLLTPP